jgi:hypothetical protein
MERISPRPKFKWENPIHVLHPLQSLLAVIVIWSGFTVAIITVKMLGQGLDQASNPFAAFADVFPGQPKSAAEARGILCAVSAYEYNPPDDSCMVRHTSGQFSSVSVEIRAEMITAINFWLREDTLRVGDLILLWGTPDIREFSRSVYLYWQNRDILAIATHETKRFSLLLPVRRISIRDAAALLILQ